jgi:hypothetical protein
VIAMRRIGLLIGFLAVVVFLLPLTAQDVKKDATTTDKKDDAKKDAEKKDGTKDPEKKDAKKEPEKKKDKVVYGYMFPTKIVNFKGETNREYTIEVQEEDPKKKYDLSVWSVQRQQQLAQQQANAMRQKDGGAALRNYMRDLANYQLELAKRQTQIYTSKRVDVRAAENAKVRSMVPPIEFDDQGFQKKWSKREFDALRNKSPLLLYQAVVKKGDKYMGLAPGIATDFDAIKAGQYIDIYMAYVPPKTKDDPKKKKSPDDEDPPAAKDQSREFVLMVIKSDGNK